MVTSVFFTPLLSNHPLSFIIFFSSFVNPSNPEILMSELSSKVYNTNFVLQYLSENTYVFLGIDNRLDVRIVHYQFGYLI